MPQVSATTTARATAAKEEAERAVAAGTAAATEAERVGCAEWKAEADRREVEVWMGGRLSGE